MAQTPEPGWLAGVSLTISYADAAEILVVPLTPPQAISQRPTWSEVAGGKGIGGRVEPRHEGVDC